MRHRVTIGKYIIYCLLISLLVYILAGAFMGYMNFSMDYRMVAAVSVGTNIVLYILFSYPILAVVIAALVPLSSLAFYIAKREVIIVYAKTAWMTVKECAIWYYDYLFSTSSKVNELYSIIIITGFIVLCSVALYLMIIIKHSVVPAMTGGIAVIAFMWFFGHEKSFDYMQRFLFASLVLFSFVQYDVKETGWKIKKGIYSKKAVLTWMGCTIAFTFIVFIFAGFLPGNIKPVNFQWLNDNVFSKIYDLGFREAGLTPNRDGDTRVFSISAFGFQEELSKLGGSVRLSDRLLLKVKVEGNIKTPIYLRGAVRDIYTGSLWAKGSQTVRTVESESEITGFAGNDDKIENTENVVLTVYPQNINTVSVFNIWKPYRVEINADIYNIDDGGEVTLPGGRVKNSVYKVVSRVPVIYSDELKNAVTMQTSGGWSISTYDYMRRCLQLPDGLPDRVRSLTKEITGKYNTDFEKASAIQNYLRSNYPYTLNTSVVPDGRDFVDYFLFDEKKGYCTYYASAMAVMSRIAGIPSRYVEGFIIEDKDMGDDGLYRVTAAKAHAWVELYFEGYGWVRFEPTASYQTADYTRPVVSTVQPELSVEGGNAANMPVTGQNGKNRMELGLEDEDSGEVYEKTLPFYVYILLCLIILIILRILMKVYMNIRSIKKADRLKDGSAAAEYYLILEKKLKSGGIERKPNETPNEFGWRIKELMSIYGINIMDLVNIFGRVRFGNCGMDENERNKFKQALKAVDRLVKDRKGVVKYILTRYLI